MDIFLLRHGIAEDAHAGQPDSERALTREGRDRLKRVLKRAREGGAAPTLILSSPYRRAIETAEIAAESLGYRGEIVRTQALAPNASPGDAWNEIRSRRGEDSVLVASHEPLMSALLAHLLNSPALRADFKKGALARIEAESAGPVPNCALKWLLTASLA